MDKVALIVLFLHIMSVGTLLVTKHVKTSHKKSNKRPGKTETSKEGYITGICREGYDDVTIYNTNYDQCIAECRSRDLCTAVNVYIKLDVCRLNFQRNLPAKACPKYVHSEKSTWKTKTQAGCERDSCEGRQKCVLDRGKPACVNAECPNIKSIENGVVFGNLVRIGEKRGFRCNKGYNLIGSKAITCQTNGEWSDDVPVCTPEVTTTSRDGPTTPPADTPVTEHTTTSVPNHTESTSNTYTTTVTTSTTAALSTYVADSSGMLFSTTAYTTRSLGDNTTTTFGENKSITTDFADIISTTPSLKGGLYGSPCTTSADCPKLFHDCRNGKCRCVFGMVYDGNLGECMKECDKLGRTFQVHEDTSILTVTTSTTTTRVDDEYACKALCLENKDCTATVFSIRPVQDSFLCLTYEVPLRHMKKNQHPDHVTFLRECNGEPQNDNEQNNDGTYDTDKTRGPLETTDKSKSVIVPTTSDSTSMTSTAPLLRFSTVSSISASFSTSYTDDSTTINAKDESITSETAPSSDSGTMTAIYDEGWSTIINRHSLYQSPAPCKAGSVHNYRIDTCDEGCIQNAATFQHYQKISAKMDLFNIIDTREQDIEGCLDKCIYSQDCQVVVHKIFGDPQSCILLTSDEFPDKKYFYGADTDVYVRDCSQ